MENSVKEILEKQLELLSEASEKVEEENTLVALTGAIVAVAHELVFFDGDC